MSIGAMVKRLRGRKGWTLRELGAVIGYSPSQLSAIENDDVKNPLTPSDLVAISNATFDREICDEYCLACDIRTVIPIKKYLPLNNIVPGIHVSTMKVIQKLTQALEVLQPMLAKLLNSKFMEDPDYREYRNRTILLLIDVKRGVEILLSKYVKHGVLTLDELKVLEEMQQAQCVEKGHHIPGEA